MDTYKVAVEIPEGMREAFDGATHKALSLPMSIEGARDLAQQMLTSGILNRVVIVTADDVLPFEVWG